MTVPQQTPLDFLSYADGVEGFSGHCQRPSHSYGWIGDTCSQHGKLEIKQHTHVGTLDGVVREPHDYPMRGRRAYLNES